MLGNPFLCKIDLRNSTLWSNFSSKSVQFRFSAWSVKFWKFIFPLAGRQQADFLSPIKKKNMVRIFKKTTVCKRDDKHYTFCNLLGQVKLSHLWCKHGHVIQGKIKDLERSKEDLHTKQLYAELYSRRENLKFFGIEERETKADSEDGEKVNTRDVLIDFLENDLGMDKPAEKIDLQRVHRLGKPVAGKIRPIIARFLRYPDREKVLRASFGLNRASLIKVLEDFPKEIIERRRKQMPKLKEAKKKGLKVAFSKAEPDKLFINGKFAPM